jgi:hypothetical protein
VSLNRANPLYVLYPPTNSPELKANRTDAGGKVVPSQAQKTSGSPSKTKARCYPKTRSIHVGYLQWRSPPYLCQFHCHVPKYRSPLQLAITYKKAATIPIVRSQQTNPSMQAGGIPFRKYPRFAAAISFFFTGYKCRLTILQPPLLIPCTLTCIPRTCSCIPCTCSCIPCTLTCIPCTYSCISCTLICIPCT